MSEREIPVLSEHQNGRAQETTNPTGYTPSEEEKKTIKLVNEIFSRYKNHRKKYDEKWMDFYKMFRGKQWKETRPSYRHSEVINMIFQMIQSEVPVQMDARPKFEFLPQEPSDREFADILNEVCDSDWQRKNWQYKLTEVIYESRFYGAGIVGMFYNPKLRDGVGDIIMQRCDPFYSFPDPSAIDVNEDRDGDQPEGFLYAEPAEIRKLKKDYPDKAKFFKADLNELPNGDKTDLNQVRFKSPVDTKTILEGTSTYDLQAKDQALKITAYLRSDEFEEEQQQEIGEDGQPKTLYVQKKKYPQGRKIVIAGGVVCEDGPNPYEDGKFPYARYVNYIDPGSFWGIGDVEQLESPQKAFNKMVSFALDVLTLTGNPVWIVDNTSGIDTDNLYNRPGLVVEKEPGSEVRREEGVQLQPYVLQLIDRMKLWFDDISGNNDVSRGVNPEGGVSAASAIQSLQEAAKTRVRQKARNLDACLQNLGQLWLSRRLQFTPAPEIIRLTNNQGASKYFKFSVSGDENGNKVATVQNYVQDPASGQYALQPPKEYQITGNFDVKVATGSNLPFAKEQKANLSMSLFKMGAIDEPALLEGVDYPNWEVIWERVKQRRDEAAMMQAQMQGGGGMPPGPGGPPPGPPGPPEGAPPQV